MSICGTFSANGLPRSLTWTFRLRIDPHRSRSDRCLTEPGAQLTCGSSASIVTLPPAPSPALSKPGLSAVPSAGHARHARSLHAPGHASRSTLGACSTTRRAYSSRAVAVATASSRFRREAHVPRGGPDGGDGGHGGDVVLVCDPSRRDLASLRISAHFRAGRGGHGAGGEQARGEGGRQGRAGSPGNDGRGARGRVLRPGRGGPACDGRRRGARRPRQQALHRLDPAGAPVRRERAATARAAGSSCSCDCSPTPGWSGCRTRASPRCWGA